MRPSLDCEQFENSKWCTNGECEYRHLSKAEKELRQATKDALLNKSHSFLNALNEPKFIIAAGPERSGSTLLYNAIRLLFLHSNNCIDSYWIHTVNKAKILARLPSIKMDKNDDDEKKVKISNNERLPHLLIKTHEYPFTNNGNNKLSDIMDLKPLIIVTHRDLRNVILSYRRVGWCSNLPSNYVEDHLKWQKIAALDLGFEDIMKDQINALRTLAIHIGILNDDIKNNKQCELWLKGVLMDLNSLKAPINKYGPDNISKLWPSHIGDKNKSNKRKLDNKTEQQIREKYSEFMKLYNY